MIGMPWYHCETTARFLNLGGAGPHKKSQKFKEGAISANLKMSIVKAQNAGHARKIVVRFKKLAQRANSCKMWCFFDRNAMRVVREGAYYLLFR